MGSGWLRYVTDSSLWIYLLHGDLVEKVFLLPWEFIVPDVVLVEVQWPWSWKLVTLGLKERELPSQMVIRVEEMVKKYPRHPGRIDLFALVLAIEEEAILLTGDKALRKAAIQEDIEAHGILWLLDEMVKRGAISKAEGCRSLKLMDAGNQRLHRNGFKTRLEDWCH